MKKLLVGFFLFLAIFVIINKNAQASCSCSSGCQAGTCEVDPGPPASCEPSCGDGYEAKPWGGTGCISLQCSCDNVTNITCCPITPTPPPPGSTSTPTPTNTPGSSPTPTLTPIPTSTPTPTPIPLTNTLTPTPIQPTVVITLSLPSSEAFSKKAATDVQKWVCLQTTPCSTGGLICSGGDPRHRVRIATKTDAKLIPNKKTYIFECLETNQGYRCTTGNNALDLELTGTDYLSSLSSAYGYKFVSFTDIQNRPIQQSSPDQVVITDSKGDLGRLEWESLTTVQAGRIMMAMQRVLDGGDNTTGHASSQQLGTFFFSSNYKTTCVMIKWDPHGTVFDINNLQPIEGVKVTLLHKNKDNNFDPIKTSDVFNGLENPQVTSSDGKYAFYVPDGTYKLKLEKEGYKAVFNVANVNKKASDVYPQLYDGGEIVTKGELELRNLAMRKITIGEKVLNFFQNILLKIKNSH